MDDYVMYLIREGCPYVTTPEQPFCTKCGRDHDTRWAGPIITGGL